LSAVNPLAALIPSRAWAVDLHALNPEQSATLLRQAALPSSD
jgi:hypothetical protein